MDKFELKLRKELDGYITEMQRRQEQFRIQLTKEYDEKLASHLTVLHYNKKQLLLKIAHLRQSESHDNKLTLLYKKSIQENDFLTTLLKQRHDEITTL